MLLTRQSGLKPTLWLDFISSQSLDSRVTASGGTNGTRVNSSGIIVAATTPRFDYDPVTLAAKGLLIEEARTNGFLRSGDFSNTAWTTSGAGIGSVTANQSLGPDGAVSMAKFAENTVNTQHRLRQTCAVAAGSSVAVTVYVKPAGRNWIEIRVLDNAITTDGGQVWFNVSTGAVGTAVNIGNGTLTAGVITYCGNGIYRCELHCKPNGTVTNVICDVMLANADASDTYLGDGASGLYLWGGQFEVGAFATSYVPTTAAAGTRAGDSLILAGAGFTSIYNATASTFYTEVDHITSTSNVTGSSWVAMEASDSSLNNALTTFINNTTAAQSLNSFAAVVNQGRLDSGAGPIAAGVVTKAACAFASGDRAISANGLTPTTGAGTHPAGLTQFSFGSDNGVTSFINGHVRRLRYYPTRLANSTLQVLTQ